MSFITRKVSYNPSVSEFRASGEMLYIAPAHLDDNPISTKWLADPCFLSSHFLTYAETIRDFVVRPDDIWLISFPKTGSNWSQEMLWMLHNDLNYDATHAIPMDKRFNYFPGEAVMEFDIEGKSIEKTAAAVSPRYIKTHLPVALLPLQLWSVKPKIVYVSRNPKDTAISYFHHMRTLLGMTGTFEDFAEAFLESKILLTPLHSHFLSFWNMRDEDNVLFLTYESMKKNLLPVLRSVAEFYGKTYTEEELKKLQKHLSFDTMRSKQPDIYEVSRMHKESAAAGKPKFTDSRSE